MGAEDIFLIPHMMLSFEDRENLEPEERKKLKELGFRFRGKGVWPVLRQITPGHPPEFPDMNRLHDLVPIIEQTLHVARRAEKEELPFLLTNENNEIEGLFRTGRAGDDPESWRDEQRSITYEPTKIPVQFDPGQVEQLGRISQSDHILEVDLPVMPSPLRDKEPAYFPFVLLILEQDSGYILHFELLTPHPSAVEMYGRSGNVLVEALLKNRIHPRSIQVKSPRLYTVLHSVLAHTNIRIDFIPNLPGVKEAYMSLIEHFSR